MAVDEDTGQPGPRDDLNFAFDTDLDMPREVNVDVDVSMGPALCAWSRSRPIASPWVTR